LSRATPPQSRVSVRRGSGGITAPEGVAVIDLRNGANH
jgi:hypothetical protein